MELFFGLFYHFNAFLCRFQCFKQISLNQGIKNAAILPEQLRIIVFSPNCFQTMNLMLSQTRYVCKKKFSEVPESTRPEPKVPTSKLGDMDFLCENWDTQ